MNNDTNININDLNKLLEEVGEEITPEKDKLIGKNTKAIKISIVFKDKPLSKETKSKIGEAHKDQKLSPETTAKRTTTLKENTRKKKEGLI